jgi:hypothetical protein
MCEAKERGEMYREQMSQKHVLGRRPRRRLRMLLIILRSGGTISEILLILNQAKMEKTSLIFNVEHKDEVDLIMNSNHDTG